MNSYLFSRFDEFLKSKTTFFMSQNAMKCINQTIILFCMIATQSQLKRKNLTQRNNQLFLVNIILKCKCEVEMKFFYIFWYLSLYSMVMQEMGKPCPPIHGEVTGAADTAASAYGLCPLYRLPQVHTQIL